MYLGLLRIQETFQNLTGAHPHLTVSVTKYGDRIEVVLTHEGESMPGVGLDQIAGFGNAPGHADGKAD